MDIKEKIQIMFDSPDQEMWELGKKLCHQLRIDYWIEIELSYKVVPLIPPVNKVSRRRNVKRKVKRYSLEEIQETSRRSMKTVYKIKLEKWKD